MWTPPKQKKGAEKYYIGCGLQYVSQLFIATFEGESGLSTGQPAIEDNTSGEQDGTGALDELAVDETKNRKSVSIFDHLCLASKKPYFLQ